MNDILLVSPSQGLLAASGLGLVCKKSLYSHYCKTLANLLTASCLSLPRKTNMSNVLTSLRTGIACCEKMIFMRHVVCNCCMSIINFKNLQNEYKFLTLFFFPFYFTDFKIVIVSCFWHGNAISVNIMLCPLCLFLSYSNQIFCLFLSS